MKDSRAQTLVLLLMSVSLCACNQSQEKPSDGAHKFTVTTVESSDVTLTQAYVCRIQALRYIEVRTPVEGYLVASPIKEGQSVKRDDLLFQIKPMVPKGKSATEIENQEIVIKAPFDGMVGRLPRQRDSFVQKGEALTTLSDNSRMRADFNVPETRYLEFKAANLDHHKADLKIELILANGEKFPELGKLGVIGTEFKVGSVAFWADFPNPHHLLRHGQTGTVLLNQLLNDAIVVPQEATVETFNKRYVYVVDKDNVAHQREIVIQNEAKDLFVVKKGVAVGDKIVLKGLRLLHDGDKVNSEDRQPKKVVANLK